MMRSKGLLVLFGLLSIIFWLFTGDNYSKTAYPLLQLNLTLSAMIVAFTWMDDVEYSFEVKIFLPFWATVLSLLAEFNVILWFLWIFAPWFRGVFENVTIPAVRELVVEPLGLRRSALRAALVMLTPPLLLVGWYRIIFGLHAVIIMAVYLLYTIRSEFRKENEVVGG